MWKIEFIEGGYPYVLRELESRGWEKRVKFVKNTYLYLSLPDESREELKSLMTVTKVSAVERDEKFSPKYLAKHKSIVMSVIERIGELGTFESFCLKCAGSDSSEVQSLIRYLGEELKLPYTDINADLKVQIIKSDDTWEVGVQLTPRPLSQRAYRVSHMSGALNPTIAYGMCLLGGVQVAESVLNPFCGSGTLIIEAKLSNPSLKSIVGFDINKEALSASYANVKEAGYIRDIRIKAQDILQDLPLDESFEVILADLPFGMVVSKYSDLEELYRAYLQLANECLASEGRLVTITAKYELYKSLVSQYGFVITKECRLTQMTNAGEYMESVISICQRVV